MPARKPLSILSTDKNSRRAHTEGAIEKKLLSVVRISWHVGIFRNSKTKAQGLERWASRPSGDLAGVDAPAKREGSPKAPQKDIEKPAGQTEP